MDNSNYLQLVRKKRQIESDSNKQFKDDSKTRLLKIIDTKMRTIMIGALASVENNIGFLWGHNEKRKLTTEEQQMKILFENIRKEILDKGNAQSRNLHTELEQYDVEWTRYNLSLPIKE